jgi:heme-degrading monooxygenase HmoA
MSKTMQAMSIAYLNLSLQHLAMSSQIHLAQTPTPPYYAVIFTSIRSSTELGYSQTASRMLELAQGMPGFLGVESARESIGITVSYWQDEDSIRHWKAFTEHLEAQRKGRTDWYSEYSVRVAKVERAYQFSQK